MHNDKLVIADGQSTIASVITTSGWNLDDVVGRARALAGMSPNPLRSLELAAIEGISAFCGGDIATATVVLIAVVSFVGLIVAGAGLAWVAFRLWAAG